MVSATERCPLFLSAIKRFFYETITVIPSVLLNSVRCREVTAIERLHCIPFLLDDLHAGHFNYDGEPVN